MYISTRQQPAYFDPEWLNFVATVQGLKTGLGDADQAANTGFIAALFGGRRPRRWGLGDAMSVVYSGPVATPSGGVLQVNLTSVDFCRALAVTWGANPANVVPNTAFCGSGSQQCSNPSYSLVPSSSGLQQVLNDPQQQGYLKNILQYIQQGQLVYDGSNWSLNRTNPVAPTTIVAQQAAAANAANAQALQAQAAAVQAQLAAAAAASPFTSTGGASSTSTESTVYSQSQNTAALLAANAAANAAAAAATAQQRGATAGSYNPSVSFNTSRGSGTGLALQPGDTWTISVTGGPPNATVTVTGPSSGTANDTVTSPIGTTDANGNYSLSGTITSDQVGVWAETWYAGSVKAGSFAFTVAIPAASASSTTTSTGGAGTSPTGSVDLSSGSGFLSNTVSIGGFHIPVWAFIVAAGGAAMLFLGEK